MGETTQLAMPVVQYKNTYLINFMFHFKYMVFQNIMYIFQAEFKTNTTKFFLVFFFFFLIGN